MNRLRNSEHLKFPVGNGNKKKKKKANSPQARWAGLYNLDSRAARTSSAGAAATENRCITGFARELLFGRTLMIEFSWRTISGSPEHFPGIFDFYWYERPLEGSQHCSVLFFYCRTLKTKRVFSERKSQSWSNCAKKKQTHSEIPASRQKVANDFSQCPPRPILTPPPTSSCTGMRGMQWCKCTIIWGFYQQAKSPSPCCS